MMKYEIIAINPNNTSFTVEIELEDRTRRRFGYPKDEGWENKDTEGKYKFEKHISEMLYKEENTKNITLDSIQSEMIGKKIEITNQINPLKKKPDGRNKK